MDCTDRRRKVPADTWVPTFWLSILTKLNNRGVHNVLIACVDAIKGFSEATETVFPKAEVQLCIVHLVRYSLNFVASRPCVQCTTKERKAVVSDLKTIGKAPTERAAELGLEAFAAKYASISQSWHESRVKTKSGGRHQSPHPDGINPVTPRASVLFPRIDQLHRQAFEILGVARGNDHPVRERNRSDLRVSAR